VFEIARVEGQLKAFVPLVAALGGAEYERVITSPAAYCAPRVKVAAGAVIPPSTAKNSVETVDGVADRLAANAETGREAAIAPDRRLNFITILFLKGLCYSRLGQNPT
jgi:hypothetical protein